MVYYAPIKLENIASTLVQGLEKCMCLIEYIPKGIFLTGLKFQLSISSVSWHTEQNCLGQGLAGSIASDFIAKNFFKLKWENRIYGNIP